MIKDLSTKETADVNEICTSMKQQIIRMFEWAKNIPAFSEFSITDQTALLKAHVAEHLLLGIAKQSLNMEDFLLLGPNNIISKLTENKGHKQSGKQDIHIQKNVLVFPTPHRLLKTNRCYFYF